MNDKGEEKQETEKRKKGKKRNEGYKQTKSKKVVTSFSFESLFSIHIEQFRKLLSRCKTGHII
jgi:hypothetical protein